MRRALGRLAVGAVAALLPGGCSSLSSSAAPGDAGGGGDSEAGAPVEAGEAGACTASSACAPASGGGRCVTTVDVTLKDPAGKPVGGVPVFACGTNVCSEPVKTSASGLAQLEPCIHIADPAVKVFDDPTWVPFAALLEGGGPSFTVPAITLTPLPAQASPLATGHNASAGVSLDVPGTVSFDLEHTTEDSQGFRAAPVNVSSFIGTGLDPASADLLVIWGLGPLNATLTPAATLTVPNSEGWAAGAQVDVFLNGADTSTPSPFAPWGTWGPIGSAHVSADGKTIATDPGAGNGLPEVAMVGLRLH